jgi:hypothetical protein
MELPLTPLLVPDIMDPFFAVALLAGLAIVVIRMTTRDEQSAAHAFDQGWDARVACQDQKAVPCPPGGPNRRHWKRGWSEASHLLREIDESPEVEGFDDDGVRHVNSEARLSEGGEADIAV